MKKSASMFMACILAFALSACGASGSAPGGSSGSTPSVTSDSTPSGEVITLRMACAATYPNPVNMYLREFKEAIEAAADNIKVELYEANSFGGPNEMVQGLQNGTIQGVAIPSGFYTIVAPEVAMLDFPFLFEDPTEMYQALYMAEIPALDAYFAERGFVQAGWIIDSNRDILSSQPITSMADFKGKNLRTYSSEISQQELTAFGANPIIMNTADVPMALQQKTIDGIQCGNTLMVPMKLHEISTHLLTGAGTPIPLPVMFNKAFLDGLSQETRDLIVNTSRDISLGSNAEYTFQFIENCYNDMRDAGVTITVCPPDMLAEMKASTAFIADTFIEKYPAIQNAYEEVLASIENYRNGG